MEDRTELLYKILLVGDVGVGKTSLMKRYVHGLWAPDYKATIGVDFGLKEIYDVGKGTTIRVQLWDIAGQERFRSLTRVYYKDAVAAIVVYDITNEASLESAKCWKNDIDHKVFLPDDTSIPCILVGNKCDKQSARASQLERIAKECHFVNWAQVSAKTGEGVEKTFNWLAEHVYHTVARAGGRQEELDALQLNERGILTSSRDAVPRDKTCSC